MTTENDWNDANNPRSSANHDVEASNTQNASDNRTANDKSETDDTSKANDKIKAMTKDQAFALATYFNSLMDTSPTLANQMVEFFGEKQSPSPGFASWMQSMNIEDQPFNAFQQASFGIRPDDNKFLANAVAESIVYPDQKQYQRMIDDPEKEALRFIDTQDTPEAEQYVSNIHKAAQNAREATTKLGHQMSEAIINKDRQAYTDILAEVSEQYDNVLKVTTEPPPQGSKHQ